jgi:hypothetical protein
MRKLATVIAITALVLAGCKDGTEIIEPPQRSSTETSHKSTAPPSAPTFSPQSRQKSPEGAVAFTQGWVAALNHATQTGDVKLLRSTSSTDCGGCQAYIRRVSDVYRDGGRYYGGRWRISEIEVEFKAAQAFVYFKAAWSGSKVRKSRASEAEDIRAGSDDLVLEVRFNDGKWTAQSFARLKT